MQRKCWDCGNVAEHEDSVVPHVLCKACGSQDTRPVRKPESNIPLLPNSGGVSTVFQWSKSRPSDVGWFWFRSGDDSPRDMTRLVECVVYVGRSETKRLRVNFGIPIDVELMGGHFAGPIPSPAF